MADQRQKKKSGGFLEEKRDIDDDTLKRALRLNTVKLLVAVREQAKKDEEVYLRKKGKQRAFKVRPLLEWRASLCKRLLVWAYNLIMEKENRKHLYGQRKYN